MGYIKEPDGVDFVIQSLPLTDNDRKELSEFIKDRKLINNLPTKRLKQSRKTKIKV